MDELIETRRARIGVIGLGYVGLPLAAAFAGEGFGVTGFDVDAGKVKAVNGGHGIGTDRLLISNMRQIQSLQQAHNDLAAALALMDDELSWEFISENIKNAVNQLDAITGRNIDADLLDRIFADFCIGK